MTLTVKNLTVTIGGKELLSDISFSLGTGERVGIIGGSGSGKTLTALAIAGLLPTHAQVRGSIRLDETELTNVSSQVRADYRGDKIGIVFQEPKTALDPLKRLGRQMTASLAHHYELDRDQRDTAALQLADRVGFREPERMVRAFPHEVSGGQRQRAAIAAAISASPPLLLADEPTTALDVTVQENILRLFCDLSDADKMSLVFISHDLAVVSQVAQKVLVLHEGRLIEEGAVHDILRRPQHEVTRALIRAAGGDV
ncbi:MAG: ATP-binding cassette domain-containing protein [Canibacter sp.]